MLILDHVVTVFFLIMTIFNNLQLPFLWVTVIFFSLTISFASCINAAIYLCYGKINVSAQKAQTFISEIFYSSEQYVFSFTDCWQTWAISTCSTQNTKKVVQGYQTTFALRENSHFPEHISFYSSLGLTNLSCFVTITLSCYQCCGLRLLLAQIFRNILQWLCIFVAMNHQEHEEKAAKEDCVKSASHLWGPASNQLSARLSGWHRLKAMFLCFALHSSSSSSVLCKWIAVNEEVTVMHFSSGSNQ